MKISLLTVLILVFFFPKMSLRSGLAIYWTHSFCISYLYKCRKWRGIKCGKKVLKIPNIHCKWSKCWIYWIFKYTWVRLRITWWLNKGNIKCWKEVKVNWRLEKHIADQPCCIISMFCHKFTTLHRNPIFISNFNKFVPN